MTTWKKKERAASIDLYYRFKLPNDENPKVKLLSAGMVLEGRFLSVSVRETKDGTFTDYIFNGLDGKVFALGKTHNIAESLDGVEPGTPVKIEYHGKEKLKGGRSVHNFDIYLGDVESEDAPL